MEGCLRLRRSTIEYSCATVKYRMFGHPHLLMRGLSGAREEIGLATMTYNLKRVTNLLGTVKLTKRFVASDGTKLRNMQTQILSASTRPSAYLRYDLLI